MSACARPPVIVKRDVVQWRAALESDRRGYTKDPEWNAAWRSDWTGVADFGQALAAIFARNLDIQTLGINAMPLRMQLEFIDRIGASVLPAQSARAPLVFKLLDTATDDATVPAGTRVAAALPPPVPSLDSSALPHKAVAPEFYTETEITAMRGELAVIYSIDPREDVYAEHTNSAGTGFAVFDQLSAVPHLLYLGHSELLRLTGTAQVVLTIDFASTGSDAAASVRVQQRPLLLDWEYLSVNGWLPLSLVEDRTERFTHDGKIVLGKLTGPDAKEDIVAGYKGYWIRATVASRVPSARIVKEGVSAVPAASRAEFELEVESTRELLAGEVVTIDGVEQATIVRTSEQAITLNAPLAHIAPGEYLTLANALPPLRPDGDDNAGLLPRIDTIRARVGFSRSDLVLDKALLENFNVDISKDFYPFGLEPARFASLYIACKEAFSRKGARIELDFSFVEPGKGSALLAIEYFNGDRWLTLGPDEELQDTTSHFTSKQGSVSFNAPPAWTESEINGEPHFWLRFRLASGDYGKPRELSVKPDPVDSSKFIVSSIDPTLAPPIVESLRIGFVVLSNPAPLEYCITENDFTQSDLSENARWSRGTFAPFTPVADRAPALHLGFSSRPPAGLVSLLVHVVESAADADAQPFVWEYWSRDGWTELSVRDTTFGLQQTGLLQFVGQADAEARNGLGGALYRIRGRLKTGLARDYITRVGGLWLNAAWAAQGTRYVRDSLGISNGEPDQTYALPAVRAAGAQAAVRNEQLTARDTAEFERALNLPASGVPILDGELVEVREWSGRGDDWETAVDGVPTEDLRFEADPQDPALKTAVWVRWRSQPHLYASRRTDRHYVVERARGVFRFPGVGANVPPAGAPIVVTYVTGGGVEGNVDAGAIHELRSGVGFVESVRNPLPASGGAIAEPLRSARDRGVQAVRHRGRAVSREDFEWLAREASSEVARARALPLEAPAGRGGCGSVGIVIVPHSIDARPMPSRELTAQVLQHLRFRASAGIAGGIRIVTPSYVNVSVRAEILPSRADEAGKVEARVRQRLLQFLHPLSGGHDQHGWEFGESIYLSEIAALLARTPGVDAVRFLQLLVDSVVYGDHVSVMPEQLIAAGDSQLKIIVPSAPHALA